MKKISNNMSVKKSSTLAGQRELLREHTNKINEIIDVITEINKRLAEIDSMKQPYTAQASTSKQTNPVCCHCEKDVNKPLTDSKPNKELRDKIMGLRSSRNFTTGIENEAYKDAIDDVLNLINK